MENKMNFYQSKKLQNCYALIINEIKNKWDQAFQRRNVIYE